MAIRGRAALANGNIRRSVKKRMVLLNKGGERLLLFGKMRGI